jgi:hypothetical protein
MNLRAANLSGLDLSCSLYFSSEEIRIGMQFDPPYSESENIFGSEVVRPYGASLIGGDRCADFSGADLTGAVLDYSDISGANFQGTSMANLTGFATVARGIVVVSSDVDGMRFELSDLRGASFNSSDFQGVVPATGLDSGAKQMIEVDDSSVQGVYVSGYALRVRDPRWYSPRRGLPMTEDWDWQRILNSFHKYLCDEGATFDHYGQSCGPGPA